ncbi:roadblock/LC7 domain-containing protein [candidate division KSB1 bacterium]|nr:roadblock/LC7 domain-containing protein [candidate division KSB1 bacterium]
MNFEQGGNGQPIVLSGEMYKTISEVISELATKTRARTIIFADMNGHPITQRGTSTDIDIASLSALAAGDFSATAEIAKIIGEKQQFKFIFHEGEKFNAYLSNVGQDFLLILIFESKSALGMIRIYTKRAIATLSDVVVGAKVSDEATSSFVDVDFNKYLNEELDKAFNF